MFYSRYFEGHVEATTASKITYPLREGKGSSSTQGTNNVNKLRNAVIGDAIASTLRDCGLDAKYVADNGYLYFDYDKSNIGIYIGYSGYQIGACWAYGDATYDYIYGPNRTVSGSGVQISDISGVFASSSSSTYLNATDYKFCVTVRGDTSSMFELYLGKYSDPTALQYNIGKFYFGKDKRTDEDVFGFLINYSSAAMYLVNKSTLLYISNTTNITSYDPSTKLALVNNYVVLIEQYLPNLPFIAFDNIFIDPGFNKVDQFYEIDGEIYMCNTPYFIKCTTPVIPITEG